MARNALSTPARVMHAVPCMSSLKQQKEDLYVFSSLHLVNVTAVEVARGC